MNTSFYLHYWPLKTIEAHLTYIRITITTVDDLLRLMNTQPLSDTLQQLHITMNDLCRNNSTVSLPDTHLWPRMKVLHTFTFIKSFNWRFIEEWILVDTITSSNIMPMLRRMNFCIVIDSNDLHPMHHSGLFTDYRHVNIHCAFMINDNREHIELNDYVQRQCQSSRRQIASATFISECWPNNPSLKTYDLHYVNKPKNRQHLFYTLPYMFDEFVQLCVPDSCISNLQVFTSSSQANYNSSSRLIKLNMSENLPSFIAFLPQVISSNRIVELHLLGCDRQIPVNIPINVSRLTLTDSLDSLNSCSRLTNIRSIQITLNHECLRFASGDWTAFHILSTLPLLKSLRVLLYDMHVPPDDISCQIIAETALMVSDFCFCFRHRHAARDYYVDGIWTKHSLFIEQLRNRMLALSLNQQPYIVVEIDGYGLNIWF